MFRRLFFATHKRYRPIADVNRRLHKLAPFVRRKASSMSVNAIYHQLTKGFVFPEYPTIHSQPQMLLVTELFTSTF
jgi:hypothetical protein